jgi:dTDP-4-amino-4,6-dideoxygalactose transaminase
VKTGVQELAVLGGRRAFDEPLHVGRPNLGDRDRLLSRIGKMLDRNWLTNNGPYVQEFEKRIADMVGVRHCIAMCNGTIALEIATRAAGLSGEVIVPSFTFVATAHALQWQEITPVFCDIDPSTHTIDPLKVEQMITPRTTAIIGVHLWGRPCHIDPLTQIAERHGLTLMFDAAHAFGCSYRDRMIGGFGLCEVFSFHATKFLNSFEGGAVVTDRDDLAARIRLMKNFGFSGYDNVIYVGTNGKMTEVAAAMGLTNLESLETFTEANRRNYRAYRRSLSGVPGIGVLQYDETQRGNYQYIVVDLDEGRAGISRDELVEVLQADGVLARRYFYPGCHRMEPYRSFFPHAGLLLPATESLARRILLLPTGTAVTVDDVERVCGIIRLAVENADAVRSGLAVARAARSSEVAVR